MVLDLVFDLNCVQKRGKVGTHEVSFVGNPRTGVSCPCISDTYFVADMCG